jgi:hypothetical protein
MLNLITLVRSLCTGAHVAHPVQLILRGIDQTIDITVRNAPKLLRWRIAAG